MEMDQTSRNKLEPVDQAKIDLLSVYSINSLTWLYQITNGIDPKQTSVKDELQRIQANMKKVKGNSLPNIWQF
jgi:exosome complex protein LRP1